MSSHKQSTPKAPTVVLPGPSAEEIAIQQQQQQLLAQQLAQQNQLFNEGTQDRATARSILANMTAEDPYSITPEEQKRINDIRDAYYKFASDSYNSSSDKQIFDQNEMNTIANLNRRGVLDSSTAERLLGQQENQRQQILQGLSSDAALKGLTLTQDQLQNQLQTNFSVGQLLSGQGTQLPQISNTISANATQAAQNLAQNLAAERTAQFNVDVQNKQAQYLSALQKSNQPRSSFGGLGALGGAAIGGLLALPTGGLSALAGAQIGGALGGVTGSLF